MKNKYKILTPTGYQSFYDIRKLKKEVFLIQTDNGSKIRTTWDHPFVVDGKIIKTSELKIGDSLDTKNGKTKIQSISPDGEDFVYDLINVENGNVYYANDYLVHNCFHPPGKPVIDPELLERLKKECKEPILVADNGCYKIYKTPNEKSFYVIGVDVGEGIGRNNSVAQILDISDLKNIEQVAVYSSNEITPYHFGTRILGLANDWGRPPIVIENNNYGQQVLDVLKYTHDYENIATYRPDSFTVTSYNRENRLGVYSHTNTKYKGLTNFRYWVNAVKSVKFYDLETLIEMAEFIQLPNYTFSKKNENDKDDRVLALVWGLFILEPSITKNFYNITETDDQGRPLNIIPYIDYSELIKKSPIFSGKVDVFKKENTEKSQLLFFIPDKGDNTNYEDKEKITLTNWLMNWNPVDKPINEYKHHNPETIFKSNQKKEQEPEQKIYNQPIVLF